MTTTISDDVVADYSARTFVITPGKSAKEISWTKEAKITLNDLENVLQSTERASKDGDCYIPGALLGTQRRKTAVKQIDLLVYDIDGVQNFAEIEALCEASGVLNYLHTTHNHLTSETRISSDHFKQWADKRGLSSKPDEAALALYLADNGKAHLKNIKFDASNAQTHIQHTQDGIEFLVHHDAVGKYRVIIPLEEPIVMATLAATTKEALQEYDAIYHGIGRELGFEYDQSCDDPSRVFYFPSHRPGTTPIAMKYNGDVDQAIKLLNWNNYPRFYAAKKGSQKKAEPRKSEQRQQSSLRSVTDKKGQKIDLIAWDKSAKLSYDIESAIRNALGTEKIRSPRRSGGFHFECPHECNHSSPGGNGTFCVNSDGEKPWTIYCSHNSCEGQGLTRLDHLAEMIRTGKIFCDDLHDEALGGEETGTPFELPTTGGFIVPLNQLPSALEAMNERWCVLKIGGKSRFMTINNDGQAEFLDKSSFDLLFEAAYYERENEEGVIELKRFAPMWRSWVGRRQYAGYGFFPAPPGEQGCCPEGYFNAYRGFSVEPKKGCWKLLLGHIYRNICQRNREYFAWLIGWLAQMVQRPHEKPGTHVILKGKEGTGKSKLGEWIIRLFGPNAMPITSASRLAGRFNVHFETLLFGLVEEAIWAGDKQAEGALKALATAEVLDYERKNLDPYCGRNYVRLMFASNEDWVVPSASGGRRWFVLEVGNEREKDNQFFKALDREMLNGGLAAMLYDLQRHDFSRPNLRAVPLTPWLVEQRIHSQDSKKRWLRDVLLQGGFTFDGGHFVPLSLSSFTTVSRRDVFESARPHFGNERRKATPSEVGTFLAKMFQGCDFGEGPRHTDKTGSRSRTYYFPPLEVLRRLWEQLTGEQISDVVCEASGFSVDCTTSRHIVPDRFTSVKPANDQRAA